MTLQRLKSIDTFRGLCMSWMILGHLTSWWLKQDEYWVFNLLSYILDPIGASGFLFIAGVSVMLSHRKKLLRSTNSDGYSYRMLRNEYFFRALFVLLIALVYNTCVAIAINNLTWIWTWFILMTIAISLFMAWPLLKISKYLRLVLGIIIWILDKLILDALRLYEGQPNIFGVLFHILYNGKYLDPILTFFSFFLIGTVVGDIIYDIFEINDQKNRIRVFKSHFLIPSLIIGVFSISLNAIFQFPQFLYRKTLPWLFYTIGIDLTIFSVLLALEIFNFLETKRSYKFLFYYSYYSLTVYLGHNILFFLFLYQLNVFNIWFFIVGAFIIIGLVLRSVYKIWSDKASLKFQIARLSLRLSRIIKSKNSN